MEKNNVKYFGYKELFEKIYRNSFWKVYTPNFFYFYDGDTAKKTTKSARKELRKMIKILNKGKDF